MSFNFTGLQNLGGGVKYFLIHPPKKNISPERLRFLKGTSSLPTIIFRGYVKLREGMFLFSPLFGEDSHFDECFSIGLKPQTRNPFATKVCPWACFLALWEHHAMAGRNGSFIREAGYGELGDWVCLSMYTDTQLQNTSNKKNNLK